MPPKGKGAAKSQKGQEKAAQKAKQKVAEDKTFGLKNKNKSKQVQKIVQAVQKNAVQQPKRGGQTAAEQKKAKKEEEEARQRELNMLFRVAPDQKKKEAEEKAAAEKAAAEAAGDAYAHLKPGEEYLWTAEDFEPVDIDDARIEEALQKELEELREKMEKEGGGTKVNPESFAIWKDKQRKLKEEAQKKNKQKMVQTGKFTGRALFEHNKDLFVDDEDADEELEREVIPDDEEEGEAAGGAIDSSLFDGGDLEVEDAEDEDDE